MNGFTQLPNWLVEAMPQMPASTFQVAVVIARQTIGYSDGNGGRREWDRISLSQFMDATGLSRQGVLNAIDAGCGKWFQRREVGQYFEYQLVNSVYQSTQCTSQLSVPVPVNSVDQLEPKLVNSVYQSTQCTSQLSVPVPVNSVDQLEPKLVNSVDPQKKEKERERKTRTRADVTAQRAAQIMRQNYTDVEPRLLTTLTNHVKRISGYSILIEKPGTDELEDQLRDDAHKLYVLGYNSDESMYELEEAWKQYSANFANKMPGKDQLYKVGLRLSSGAFKQPNNGTGAGLTLVPWEDAQQDDS
jgi:hypothetical protein